MARVVPAQAARGTRPVDQPRAAPRWCQRGQRQRQLDAPLRGRPGRGYRAAHRPSAAEPRAPLGKSRADMGEDPVTTPRVVSDLDRRDTRGHANPPDEPSPGETRAPPSRVKRTKTSASLQVERVSTLRTRARSNSRGPSARTPVFAAYHDHPRSWRTTEATGTSRSFRRRRRNLHSVNADPIPTTPSSAKIPPTAFWYANPHP